jgi:hypothetical protein
MIQRGVPAITSATPCPGEEERLMGDYEQRTCEKSDE